MQSYNEFIDKASTLMVDAYTFLHANPELGYEEWTGHGYMKSAFSALGYKVEEFGDIPGFTATFDTGRSGLTVALFGELDGMKNFSHPDCNKVTGAVHACGHDFQCANLLGVAYILKNYAFNDLSGCVKFVIVPAEEGVDVLKRYELIKSGVIKYTSGKSEIIRRGILDDVDISYQNHIGVNHGIKVLRGANGLIRKSVNILGKSAHAGANPFDGINALYCANTALTAINALRETFKEEDCVRVHPIITKGGDGVNTVPGEVRIESYVRGANLKAIKETNYKVNRAIAGSAITLGANVRVLDLIGCMPLQNSSALANIVMESARFTYGENGVTVSNEWETSSSDMGDVSSIMPTVMAWVEGAKGSLHGADFVIEDVEGVCRKSCVQQIELIRLLLSNDCLLAKKVIKGTPVPFKTKEEYLDFIDGFFLDKELIEYGDGIKVKL